jgi:hypothetical protein
MCWHQWSKWSEVIEVPISHVTPEGWAQIKKIQKRKCIHCNKAQERTVA